MINKPVQSSKHLIISSMVTQKNMDKDSILPTSSRCKGISCTNKVKGKSLREKPYDGAESRDIKEPLSICWFLMFATLHTIQLCNYRH